MKKEGHPEYHQTTITCACGAVYHTGSTKKDIHVELCSACHPFFTGKQKLVDSAGRVERFQRKYGGASQRKKTLAVAQAKAKKRAKTAPARSIPLTAMKAAELKADEKKAASRKIAAKKASEKK